MPRTRRRTQRTQRTRKGRKSVRRNRKITRTRGNRTKRSRRRRKVGGSEYNSPPPYDTRSPIQQTLTTLKAQLDDPSRGGTKPMGVVTTGSRDNFMFTIGTFERVEHKGKTEEDYYGFIVLSNYKVYADDFTLSTTKHDNKKILIKDIRNIQIFPPLGWKCEIKYKKSGEEQTAKGTFKRMQGASIILTDYRMKISRGWFRRKDQEELEIPVSDIVEIKGVAPPDEVVRKQRALEKCREFNDEFDLNGWFIRFSSKFDELFKSIEPLSSSEIKYDIAPLFDQIFVHSDALTEKIDKKISEKIDEVIAKKLIEEEQERSKKNIQQSTFPSPETAPEPEPASENTE